MADLKALFGHAVAPLLFSAADIVAVDVLGPRFVRLRLAGTDIGKATFRAGDKVQVLLPDAMRTYTPFDVDGDQLSLLMFAHGDTPASRFALSAHTGQRVQFLGPQSSLPLSSTTGPAILVGDESSFAVARTLQTSRAGSSDARFVFEVGDIDESRAVAQALGLSPTCTTFVPRTAGDAHLPALTEAVVAASSSSSSVFLAGRAGMIQQLRSALKERKRSVTKNKAYWAAGKRGLD